VRHPRYRTSPKSRGPGPGSLGEGPEGPNWEGPAAQCNALVRRRRPVKPIVLRRGVEFWRTKNEPNLRKTVLASASRPKPVRCAAYQVLEGSSQDLLRDRCDRAQLRRVLQGAGLWPESASCWSAARISRRPPRDLSRKSSSRVRKRSVSSSSVTKTIMQGSQDTVIFDKGEERAD